MTDIRITRDYPHPPGKVWRALTDRQLVSLWTATGRGGTPEGFSPEVGCRFRFVGKPLPGWDGVVRCEVLEVEPPSLLRYSWKGDEDGRITQVTYLSRPAVGRATVAGPCSSPAAGRGAKRTYYERKYEASPVGP